MGVKNVYTRPFLVAIIVDNVVLAIFGVVMRHWRIQTQCVSSSVLVTNEKACEGRTGRFIFLPFGPRHKNATANKRVAILFFIR